MTERTVFKSMSFRHVLSVLPNASVFDAACAMTRANFGSILVIDASNALLGIVTERDMMTRVLAKELDPKTTAVTNIMTRNPHCVPPETKVTEAILLMMERGFRNLPVVSGENKIMGVFSARDALPQELQAAESLAEFNNQLNDSVG
jgi:CBS domain-containing protein